MQLNAPYRASFKRKKKVFFITLEKLNDLKTYWKRKMCSLMMQTGGEIKNFKWILHRLEVVPKLKINFNKWEIVGSLLPYADVERGATVFGCHPSRLSAQGMQSRLKFIHNYR